MAVFHPDIRNLILSTESYFRAFVCEFCLKLFMKTFTLIFYMFYVALKTSWRLATKPYQAVRRAVEHPIFFPFVFQPLLFGVVFYILVRIIGILISTTGIIRDAEAIFFASMFLSLVLWQMLLLYFFVNIISAHWRKRHLFSL